MNSPTPIDYDLTLVKATEFTGRFLNLMVAFDNGGGILTWKEADTNEDKDGRDVMEEFQHQFMKDTLVFLLNDHQAPIALRIQAMDSAISHFETALQNGFTRKSIVQNPATFKISDWMELDGLRGTAVLMEMAELHRDQALKLGASVTEQLARQAAKAAQKVSKGRTP